MMAAKNRRTVALIERHREVGGGCTHWGTIPSKALRQAVKTLYDARRNPLLREFRDALNVSFPRLLSSAGSVIDAQVASRRRFYDRNRVPVLSGDAWYFVNTTFNYPTMAEAYRTAAFNGLNRLA